MWLAIRYDDHLFLTRALIVSAPNPHDEMKDAIHSVIKMMNAAISSKSLPISIKWYANRNITLSTMAIYQSPLLKIQLHE
jgi:hypothetical protein